MKARGVMALCISAALVTAACGDGVDNDSTLDPMPENAPATEPARPSAGAAPMERGADQVISGNLGNVDTDARTFTLSADNREQTFRFNDDTDVTGASGTQGLASREGARVTVHYRQDGGANVATRIMLEGGTTPMARPAPDRGASPSGTTPPERR